MSEQPVLYGAAYSVYVRAARLALTEKGVAYRLVPVDVFAPGGPPPEHLARHPFGRIPAFEHRGFALYETGAITRYVDEAFPGPALQPQAPQPRARMNQVIGILDVYAYRTLVWDIYVERVSAPKRGRASDEARIRDALPWAATCLAALDAIMGPGPFLTGPELTLADLHAAPVFALFTAAPEAEPLLLPHPGLQRWWGRIAARPSMAATSQA
ncbi:glutathione S-transferase family protein [Plastoroseomonas hellenica]|uniref:glutathione S-transferase family protein n=1 Tax=Plastoroseomonas hellenica TaxID=2687306 RepID=UPI001BA5BC51|nr:glutathione S-transferase family protein [Plastoroseomonas hellenica]MBR0646468.1 glutathione S-transferase family protein [Plastoroseomonas hellenica]